MAALIAVACSPGAAGEGPATPGSTSPEPGNSGATGGGSEPGNTGSGTQISPLPLPSLGGPDGAQLVVAHRGRIDPHPVGAESIEATLEGRHVSVRLTWWSGIEPCTALDSVAVAKSGFTINLTIREGANTLSVACIEIAVHKATVVDVGELAPGAYTITAFGDAPPIQVTVG